MLASSGRASSRSLVDEDPAQVRVDHRVGAAFAQAETLTFG